MLGKYRIALIPVFVQVLVRGYRPNVASARDMRAYFDGGDGVGVDDNVGSAGGAVVVEGGW